ncbi:hypothetical protein HDU84_003849 [Entophlyctis sp. JEL0112]|nr:hypothetical protein HDU84_003849 [Entophlyctis sp. JEL0112]
MADSDSDSHSRSSSPHARSDSGNGNGTGTHFAIDIDYNHNNDTIIRGSLQTAPQSPVNDNNPPPATAGTATLVPSADLATVIPALSPVELMLGSDVVEQEPKTADIVATDPTLLWPSRPLRGSKAFPSGASLSSLIPSLSMALNDDGASGFSSNPRGPSTRLSLAQMQKAKSSRSKRLSIASGDSSFVETNWPAAATQTPSIRGSLMAPVGSIQKRLSVASVSLAVSVNAVMASINDGIAATTAGYSNNWAFGLFERWWSVSPSEFAYVPIAKPIQNSQPRPIPAMSAKAAAGLSPNFETSDSSNSGDSILGRNGRNLSATAALQSNNIPNADNGNNANNKMKQPQMQMPGTSTALAASTPTPPARQQQQHQAQAQSTTPSAQPIIQTICCPCVVYAQSREMFLRTGGVLEDDLTERVCGAQVDASECMRVSSAAACFAALIAVGSCCVAHRRLRNALRTRYALRDDETEGECGEFVVSCCCLPCGLVQERREIIHWERVVDGARKRRSLAVGLGMVSTAA